MPTRLARGVSREAGRVDIIVIPLTGIDTDRYMPLGAKLLARGDYFGVHPTEFKALHYGLQGSRVC